MFSRNSVFVHLAILRPGIVAPTFTSSKSRNQLKDCRSHFVGAKQLLQVVVISTVTSSL